jgi:membrane-associated protease RseP (regulator of RpoE activity)
MSAKFRTRCLVCLAMVGLACAARPLPPEMNKQEIAVSVSDGAIKTIDDMVSERKRIHQIEYVLSTATAKRCGPLARPQSGVMLSKADSFEDQALRTAVRREFSLADNLGVIYVLPDSGFERAGVVPGDQLLEVDGAKIGSADAFLRLMLAEADRSSIEVLVSRGGRKFRADVPLDAGCPVKFTQGLHHRLTTSQYSKLLVEVPTGVLGFIDNDNTLAVVMAHQLAHALFDNDAKSWSEQEARADRIGLQIAGAAGYDVSGAVEYWEAVAMEYPWLIVESAREPGALWEGYINYSHFGIGNRIAAIRETAAKIGEIQAESRERSGAN